jgi:hypothetical protein
MSEYAAQWGTDDGTAAPTDVTRRSAERSAAAKGVAPAATGAGGTSRSGAVGVPARGLTVVTGAVAADGRAAIAVGSDVVARAGDTGRQAVPQHRVRIDVHP